MAMDDYLLSVNPLIDVMTTQISEAYKCCFVSFLYLFKMLNVQKIKISSVQNKKYNVRRIAACNFFLLWEPTWKLQYSRKLQ